MKKKKADIDKHINLLSELNSVILKREITSNDKAFVDDLRELDEILACWFRNVVYRTHDLNLIIDGVKKK